MRTSYRCRGRDASKNVSLDTIPAVPALQIPPRAQLAAETFTIRTPPT